MKWAYSGGGCLEFANYWQREILLENKLDSHYSQNPVNHRAYVSLSRQTSTRIDNFSQKKIGQAKKKEDAGPLSPMLEFSWGLAYHSLPIKNLTRFEVSIPDLFEKTDRP